MEPYQEKPGEEYMNEAQLAHFKRILEAWRNQLRDEVDRTVSHMQDEAANFPDPVDRAAQEEEFSLELRNRDRERKLIKKIEKTLKKVEDEDFGYCESCGVEIGIRRLEARPTADLCIDCKTLAEIREKTDGGLIPCCLTLWRESLPPGSVVRTMTDSRYIGRFAPSPLRRTPLRLSDRRARQLPASPREPGYLACSY
ncbi:RNA polymerase-binding transcription factor [Klebsiella pneumoniae]|uniref:RNA polymerase-binding transcription factor DksA n=2 Tax=Enterobacteriaceae TaxID=543 RepID=A0A377TLM7_KLEPN|nr:RNA polymerase-binding transcription factor [Klebsiella pneumoniae]